MKTSKFKMTEIGEIPADWEVKRLGDIGEPLMCKRILKSQTSEVGDIPFYKIGTFGKVADAYIPYQLFNSFKHQYSYPRKGDILLSAAGTIGRTVVFDGHDSYFQDSNIVWIDNDERIVTNDYLKWFYCVIDWVTEDGGIVTRLYNNNIRNALVSCPPLAEQKAIAEALSDADALIAAQEELIEKKRAIKQGAMQELLTGKKRLVGFKNSESSCLCASVLKNDAGVVEGGFNTETQRRRGTEFKMTEIGLIPEDWECCKIGELAKICTGNRNTQDKNDNGRYPFYVRSPIVERIDEYGFNTEGVVTVGDGVGTGKVFHYVNGCFGLHQRCYLIDSFNERLNAKYFYKVFSERFFNRVMQMTAKSSVDSVRREMISEMLIPVPPLAEQKKIAEALSDIDAEIEALEAKRAKYESIKQGMMQELLSGKTRLKGA